MLSAPDPSARPRLEASFYDRPVEVVAREMLGCFLVHRVGRSIVGGRIVETEAYGGPGDPGSHADRSPNGRARIMFGPPGIAYVYFTYGMHFCFNAVTGPEGVGSAVLVRALEPLWGLRAMRARGCPATLPDHKLAAGPGRLCRALGIDRHHNSADLQSGRLRLLAPDRPPREVLVDTRIGLRLDDGRPWRFRVPSTSLSRGASRPSAV